MLCFSIKKLYLEENHLREAKSCAFTKDRSDKIISLLISKNLTPTKFMLQRKLLYNTSDVVQDMYIMNITFGRLCSYHRVNGNGIAWSGMCPRK